jgi:uncharacterized membrane protein
MKTNVKKLVITSMLAALCCVATMVIKIPSPLKGYLNLGDCIVLISGWLLSPVYAFIAAGAGSALADIFSGYVIYAPATFVIKGIMAVVAYTCFKNIHKTLGNTPSRIIGGSLAEIIMIFGYYIFEGFLYGFGPSVVNIPANAVQGVAGLVVGMLLVNVFEKTKIF